MNIVEIKCAHVEHGARVEEIFDLGDLTDAPRVLFLCPMCWDRMQARVLGQVTYRAVRDAVRANGSLRKLLSDETDGS